MEALNSDLISVGTAIRALPGQSICGDTYLVRETPNGVLVAAIDGLGHGPEAAEAGDAAVQALARDTGEDVVQLVKNCHERLHDTRGAVMSLALFDSVHDTMTWLGIGNVEACVVRADSRSKDRPYVLSRGGVVGISLPTLRAETVPVSPGDALIMATDGIRSGFSRGVNVLASPQEIADELLKQFARDTDDALVVVVRWLGRHK